MPENYRGYELNVPNDPNWGTRENIFHKQIINRVEDDKIDDAPNDGVSYVRNNGSWVDSSIASFNNNLYVSPNGSDVSGTGTIEKPYKTISHTLNTITDAAIDKTYGIVLAAGNYPETQIVCKEFVTIASIMPTAIVQANDPDTDLFVVTNNSPLVGFNIVGPSNAKAVSATNAGAVTTMRNITMINSYDGIYINGLDTNVTLIDFYVTTTNPLAEFNTIIEIAQGHCDIQGTTIRKGTKANTMFKVSGSNSDGHMWVIDNDSEDITRFIDVQNGGSLSVNNSRSIGNGTEVYINNATLSLNGLSLSSPDIGIDVGPVGFSTLICNRVNINNSTSYDLRTQTSNLVLAGLENLMSDSKIQYTMGPPISHNFSHFSSDSGDEGLRIKAELGVGSPDRPSESAFGEGDSYTRGILVYQYDDTNGYNDITEEAKSNVGSGFGWSDTAVNSAIYMTSTLQKSDLSDYVQYFGVKVSITTSGVIGTGAAITEYWNGASWVPFTIMRTEGSPPFLPRAESLVDAPTGDYQLRHNALMELDWAKTDPMGLGNDYYWTRVRITSPITTSPVFEQLKVHSNRTEFNEDGWVEYFGKARQIGRLPWTYGMLEAAAASPANQDNYLSDNLDVGKRENAFANNTIDRIGLLAPVPFDMDTSTPIRMRWATSYSGNVGDVDWIIRWGYSTENDLVYFTQGGAPATHPTEQSTSLTVTVPATVNQLQWNAVDLSVFGINPRHSDGISDILWVTIERDGSTDTFSGTAAMVALSADYLKWTEGGHL